jgi:hypothetical protein
MPTLAAAAGIAERLEKMKAGFNAGTKTFKVHLHGYDLTPLLKGEARRPRVSPCTISTRAEISMWLLVPIQGKDQGVLCRL